MSNREGDALLKGLEQIAGLAVAQNTVQSMLEVVVSLSKQLVPAADGAGLTLRDEGRWTTTASTDDFVVDVDAKQYAVNSGPCLSSARVNESHRSDDLTTDDRWPEFAKAAAEVGVHSVMSAPLSAGTNAVGALNLYAFERDAFGSEAENIATVLARHATIALANRAALGRGEDLAEQLRDALLSREVIGEAKGMLMERGKLTSDEALTSCARCRKHRTASSGRSPKRSCPKLAMRHRTISEYAERATRPRRPRTRPRPRGIDRP